MELISSSLLWISGTLLVSPPHMVGFVGAAGYAPQMHASFKTMASPVGRLTLVGHDDALMAILWEADDPERVPLGPTVEARNHPLLRETARQLDAYFARRLTAFDLPLEFRGTTFQKQVWAALLTIPYGATRSYAEIAQAIGRPDACRAVGAANGRNPISIVAPCHRVVGASGALTGFAGGLPAKRHLLSLERGDDPALAARQGALTF